MDDSTNFNILLILHLLVSAALQYETERVYIAFMIEKSLASSLKPLEREFATEIISGSQFAIRGSTDIQ